MTTFLARCEQALASTKPDDTAVVACISADGVMVCQVKHAGRPIALVDLASSLLEQAAERIEEGDTVKGSLTIGDATTLLSQIDKALVCLLDRFAESGDGDTA